MNMFHKPLFNEPKSKRDIVKESAAKRAAVVDDVPKTPAELLDAAFSGNATADAMPDKRAKSPTVPFNVLGGMVINHYNRQATGNL